MKKTFLILWFAALVTACSMTIRPRQSELVATLGDGLPVEEIYNVILSIGSISSEYPAKKIPETGLISKEFQSSDGVIVSSVFSPLERKVNIVVSNRAMDKTDSSEKVADDLYRKIVDSGCCSSVELNRKQ